MYCNSKNKCQKRKRRRRRWPQNMISPPHISDQRFERPLVRASNDTSTPFIDTFIQVQHDLNILRNIVKNALNFSKLSNIISKREMMSTRHLMQATGFLFLLVCYSNYHVSCQSLLNNEPPTLFTSQSPIDGNQRQQQFGGAEPRADPSIKPQSNAFDNFVNFLNTYASQQQTAPTVNQNRRSPASLPAANGQRTQTVLSQQAQFSTPVNPFIGQQFQSSNRRINFPNQNLNVNSNNNQLFMSSSPPTPYLTLNRIASMANNNQNPNQNSRVFNVPAPINTIPLGSLQSSQQQSGNNRLSTNPVNPGVLVPPTRVIQPQRSGPPPVQQQFSQPSQASQIGVQQQKPPISMPPPPPSMNTQNQGAIPVNPISGFAPSGPPPSLAANNAMVVVQSPPNAIGRSSQQQRESTLTNQNNNKTMNDEKQTNNEKLESTNSDGSDDKSAQSSTTSLSFINKTESIMTTMSIDQDKKSKSSDGNGDDGVTVADQSTLKESNWNPVEGNRTVNKVNLSPSPDIVTVPPGYNPDNPNNQPQNYDIAVSTQMGTPIQKQKPFSLSPQHSLNTTSSSTVATSATATSSISANQQIAPTAITTIIWSPPPSEILSSSVIQPTKSVKGQMTQTVTAQSQQPIVYSTFSNTTASIVRDSSPNDDPPSTNPADSGVVYGKPQTRDSKPTPPNQLNPSPVIGQASIESSVPASGRPFIQPVQMDTHVRPFLAGAQSQSVLKSNHGHQLSLPFRGSRPLNGSQSEPMHVGSGFTITANGNQTMPTGDIQDYVAGQLPPFLIPSHLPPGGQMSNSFQVSGNHEPTISGQGGQDPASFDLYAQDPANQSGNHVPHKHADPNPLVNPSNDSVTTPNSSSATPQRIRRPTFKPKPAVPPIRIDSCIVGDDSSCDQSHNERCVTEYGISSCHCKPGHARLSQLRGYCGPVSSFQLNMKIDKLSDDRRLVFNHTLDNSNSEEYQYMEFETIQALASAIQQTSLAKQFMGARVNKFFERKGKVWVNMSINFESNNLTKSDKIQNVAAQELLKVIQNRLKPIGDSNIMLDGSKESVSKLIDVNECANRDLNDCSKYATCVNDFGSFQCHCMAGYEDKYQADDKSKHGRICLGCSPSYCSNRGECSITDGHKQCKCRPNFIGARCDIDSEILAVAIGGSLVGIIILIITFWCLYVFNRRWKREQQKMDAMSATSGLTFNYVNSTNNSLMSPTRAVGGLHRSGGHQVGAMAANYGQRFGAAIVNGARSGQHYAPDQQAIIGSTSSGSSAASQPIGCNPYAPGYHYEDAGLLIAPASSDSSEQTSPSSDSYRGTIGGGHNTMLSQQMTGNAYTLSGHHHHHHPHLHHHHNHQSHSNKGQPQITQFNPAGEYITINSTLHCPTSAQSGYDGRWRTLQQDKQSALIGYYLSPDMLVSQQQHQHQHQQQHNLQQLYAAPQRELCIDTGGNNANKSRRQQGRSTSGGFQTLRSRSQSQINVPRNSMHGYHISDYDQERPI